MHHICIWFYNNLALILSICLFSGNRHKVFLVLYAFLYGILALSTIFVFDLLNQFDAETLISFTIVTTPIWSLFVLKGIFFCSGKFFQVLVKTELWIFYIGSFIAILNMEFLGMVLRHYLWTMSNIVKYRVALWSFLKLKALVFYQAWHIP